MSNEAGAGPNPSLNPNAATNFGEMINQVGDGAVFKHFQRSGKLDFMDIDAAGNPQSNGNVVVYPSDLHTNPEYGQLIHFDIYFKQNPKMEDRQQLFNDLAYTQWTVTEMAHGLPYKHLLESK